MLNIIKIFKLLNTNYILYDIINNRSKEVLSMYVLTKSVLALMIGFIIAVFLGLILVPLLRKIKASQVTSKFVKQHKSKSGTPTAGGLIFIISTILTIIALVFTNKMTISTNLIIVLFVFFGYALIGFIDDFLKGRTTESDVNIVYEIVNYRYNNNLPVIISTEKKPSELIDFDERIKRLKDKDNAVGGES